MPYDPRTVLEPQDPVAHPHYPSRPPRAVVVRHILDTQSLQDEREDQSFEEASESL